MDTCCIRLGSRLGIGELTVSSILDEEDGTPYTMDLRNESAAALSLRKEATQVTKVVKCMSRYLLLISIVYLIQNIISLSELSLSDFKSYWSFESELDAEKLYHYTREIEYMKIVHAISLVVLSGYIVIVSSGYKVLDIAHYY
jgi:hypothetical protein